MNRRGFITGLVSLVAAPAIVRIGSLMPVRVMPEELVVYGRSPAMDALPDLLYINRVTRTYMDVMKIRDKNILLVVDSFR